MAEWNYEEWSEKAGIENLKHRLATGDVLLAQANTLLSILLVGVGGALVAPSNAGDKPPQVGLD